MIKKHKLEEIKEVSENPFLNYKSDRQFDESFIDSLSKTARKLIKYLIYKQDLKEEKFLFKVDEFNSFMRYINMPDPSDGLAELCDKGLLEKTKNVNIYWVNKNLFNSGVFEPKYMVCAEEDSPS